MAAYRHLFARISRHQRRRHKDAVQAFISSLIFFSLPPYLWLMLLDDLVGEVFEVPAMMERIGRWPFAVLAFAIVLLGNYLVLSSDEARAIDSSDQQRFWKRWGAPVLLSYFLLPVLAYGTFLVVTRNS